ncbi:MAG: GNAT family N-acetyltransferase, partial [Alphaproteobacteria bacterium]|nr:GNAT family N-acetyltransferase [Alphaproteobacteria bacterium]
MTASFAVAPARLDEMPILLDWAAAEGWNPGLADGPCFHAADPRGFLIGRLDGRPVSGISLVQYGDAFAFLGFYLCRPEMRGRGFGYAVWTEATRRFGSRTVGLDGVPELERRLSAMRADAPATIDLSGTDRIDTSVAWSLVRAERRLDAAGGRLEIAGAGAAVAQL